MDSAQLMDRVDAASFRMITLLLQEGGPLPLGEIQARTGLSRKTFLKYLDEFNELLDQEGLGAQLSLEGEVLRLQAGRSFQLAALLGILLRRSLRFRILEAIWSQQVFSIQSLATRFQISEATLNRQLLGLNQLLEEFGLVIQNGRLRGSELQIRYLAFRLLQEISLPADVLNLQHQAAFVEFQTALQGLTQKDLGLDLALWWSLAQMRQRFQYGESEFLGLYQEHPTFQQLKQCLLPLDMEERELKLLFAFLVGQGLLSSREMERVLAFGGPIQDKVTELLQALKELGVSPQGPGPILDELGRLASQVYFFKGGVATGDGERKLQSYIQLQPQSWLMVDVAGSLALRLVAGEDSRFLAFEWDFIQILDYLGDLKQVPQRVAVDSHRSVLVLARMVRTLKQYLQHNRLMEVEAYQEGMDYSLVVTDAAWRTYSYQTTYLLQNDLLGYDLEMIRELLQTDRIL